MEVKIVGICSECDNFIFEVGNTTTCIYSEHDNITEDDYFINYLGPMGNKIHELDSYVAKLNEYINNLVHVSAWAGKKAMLNAHWDKGVPNIEQAKSFRNDLFDKDEIMIQKFKDLLPYIKMLAGNMANNIGRCTTPIVGLDIPHSLQLDQDDFLMIAHVLISAVGDKHYGVDFEERNNSTTLLLHRSRFSGGEFNDSVVEIGKTLDRLNVRIDRNEKLLSEAQRFKRAFLVSKIEHKLEAEFKEQLTNMPPEGGEITLTLMDQEEAYAVKCYLMDRGWNPKVKTNQDDSRVTLSMEVD